MKITAKSFLSLLSLTLITAAPLVLAQDNSAPPPDNSDNAPPPPRKGKGKGGPMDVNQLKAKLNLTDDQVTKVKGIMRDSMQKGRALREDTSLSDDEKREKGQALRKDAHDQIRAALTPDQQKTFDAMPMPGGRRGKKGPPPPDGDAPPPPPPANSST